WLLKQKKDIYLDDCVSVNMLEERKKKKVGEKKEPVSCVNEDRATQGRIEAVGSDGHLRSCPSGLGGVVGCRENRRYDRLAGTRKIRVGTWNVGSLTGKHLELADALGRHKVDIAYFQETKWKGSSTREGNGYKLWYSSSSSGRNVVGVILTTKVKDNVVKVSRCGDRIMALSVVIKGETVNVISANAPQVGLSDAIKKKFWDELDEIVRECLTDQHLFIGGDLNGHIGTTTDGYARVHGGFGFGARNEEVHAILEFAVAHNLVVVNSFFKKRDAHLITFQSGSHNTQIDYLLERRGDLRTCKECRAFPSEACSSQHRLVTYTFKATVSEKLSALEEDMSTSSAKQMWNTLAHTIKYVARDSLGVSNLEDIDSGKERYKVAKREAKIAVARAKDKAYEDLYKKLDSKEVANDIYKIAKARKRRRRDLGNVRYIKDEGGRTIVREEDIRKRWGEYFYSLFNESSPEGREVGSTSPHLPQDCYYSRINQREVRIALQKMGRNKVVGPGQFPLKAWKCLKDEGVKWLTCLFKQYLLKRKDA
ncbi:retrovirus-related pol polyprotein LINE-1, partial [Tanacetum coccineum]